MIVFTIITQTLNIANGKNNSFLKLSSNVKVPMNSRKRYQSTIFSIYLDNDHCTALWQHMTHRVSGLSSDWTWGFQQIIFDTKVLRHKVRVTMIYLACEHITWQQLFHIQCHSSARIRCCWSMVITCILYCWEFKVMW